MLDFNSYLDLLEKIRFDEILKEGKDSQNDKVLDLINKVRGLTNKNKVESSYKTLAALGLDDFADAYADMKDPIIYAKILELLNRKLAKDGDEFKIDTPENKMLGLANRYAWNAQECKKLRKWTLFAFYMRSLAYFIPLLIEKANMKEETIMKKVEAGTTSGIDAITCNIPLLLRLFEYAKEDAKTDMDLHYVIENLLKLTQEGKQVLTMDDYDAIIPAQTQETVEAAGQEIMGKKDLEDFKKWLEKQGFAKNFLDQFTEKEIQTCWRMMWFRNFKRNFKDLLNFLVA